MKYAEKLKDPRWQRKRLEVLERAGWKCEYCLEENKTLHVHHGAYLKGLDPWEYPLSSLHCLCEHCHDLAEVYKAQINSWMLSASLENIEVLAEELLPNFETVWELFYDYEHRTKS